MRPDKSVLSRDRNVKCTFWNFDLSRSEQEASRFRTEPHIVKSTDGNLFRNPGCIKTVLYSKLQSLLIENFIMLTLVENRRRVVQAVKYVIQRRAEQISTVPRTCTCRKIAISFRYYFTVKTKKKILNIMAYGKTWTGVEWTGFVKHGLDW